MGISSNSDYDKLITGSFTAVSNTLDIDGPNSGTETIQVTGTWVGTIVVEVSNDNSTWIIVPVLNINSRLQSLSITSNGLYSFNGGGFANKRLRASAWTSGTATLNNYASDNPGFIQLTSESLINNPIPQSASLIGGTDGTNLIPLLTDSNGRLVTSALTGFGAAFSFGDRTTAATTTVPLTRATYTEQTTNAQRSIVSANANDSSAGTGARTVKITYLDSTGAGPFTETITMNGITAVNTVATNICFIEKMEVITAGSTGSNVGIISLKAATAGGGATITQINATDNRTLNCLHYVPIGKTCNITGISCGHNGTTVGSGGLFVIRARPIGVANAATIQISDFVRLYGQSSTFARTYVSPIKVIGPAYLQVFLTPETASSTIYRCAIDFFEP